MKDMKLKPISNLGHQETKGMDELDKLQEDNIIGKVLGKDLKGDKR